MERDFPTQLDHIISFPPVGEVVEKALKISERGNLILAQISFTPILINKYSNLWGRNIKTVYNVRRSSAYRMLELAKKVDLSIGKRIFRFDELQDGMILARRELVEEMTSAVKI